MRHACSTNALEVLSALWKYDMTLVAPGPSRTLSECQRKVSILYGQKSQNLIPMSALMRLAEPPDGQKHRGGKGYLCQEIKRFNTVRLYQHTV